MLRSLFAAVLAAATLALGAIAEDADIQIEDIRDEVIAGFRAKLGNDHCLKIVGPGSFMSGPNDESCEVQISVDNLYAQIVKAPGSKERELERFIRVLTTIGSNETDLSNFRARLVPIVRPRYMYDRVFPDGTNYLDTIITEPFHAGLIVVLMLDSPEALMAVTKTHLEEKELDSSDAFLLAEQNLRRLVGPINRETHQGVSMLTADTGLASGLLALPETCPITDTGTAYYLANRNEIISAPFDRSEATGLFFYILEQWTNSEQPFSEAALVCNRGEWITLVSNEKADSFQE